MSEDRFSTIAEITRRMKLDKVREFGDSTDGSDCDLLGFCACIRGGKQLFAVYHESGPLAAREAAAWSAMLLSCDEIFVIADAYGMSVPADPEEGQPLLPRSPEQMEEEFYRNHPEVQPGFLGKAWQEGRREGITECIMIIRYALVGPPLQCQYSYVREGRKLTWGKILASGADATIGGAIDDYVKEGFRRRKDAQPKIDELLRTTKAAMQKENFSPAEQQYWTDRGMARFVSSKKAVRLVHYLGAVPELGLPDAVFAGGKELDNESYEELGDD